MVTILVLDMNQDVRPVNIAETIRMKTTFKASNQPTPCLNKRKTEQACTR